MPTVLCRPQQALREGRLQVASMKWAAAGLLLWTFLPPRPLPPAQPYQLLRALPQPNPEFLTKQPRSVAVVGGGLAGCVTAKVLLQQGYQVQIFEQSAAVHCSKEGALPDFPRQRESCEVYLQRFCESFGLDACMHSQCRVQALRQQEDGTWQIRTSKGLFESDFLVVATGFQPVPTPIKQQSFPVYTDADLPDLQGKEVLLVGPAAASAPVLKRLIEAKAKVICAIPGHEEAGIGGILTAILAHTRVSSFLQSHNHGFSGLVARTGDVLLTWAYGFAWPDLVASPISFRQALSQVETGQSLANVRVIRGPVEVNETNVLVGQNAVNCEAVVLARDRKPGIGLLPSECEGLYRNTISPGVRNAAFVGLFKSQHGALLTSLQAKWLVDVLRGRVVLPSFEHMQTNLLSWHCPAYQAADFFLADCGLRIYRRSWAAEFCLSISADNYAEVLTHSR